MLIKKGYFHIFENAEQYVNNIYNFIQTIPAQQHYPVQNSRHGKYYSRYKANMHTTYYIVFDIMDEVYYVSNIFNNHSRDYNIYIKKEK